ncbi:MAG: hypothetical protein JWN78_519 [Bacteroidota bacterium]|nr:hypothetical protein [Bacteroidota bacterium]
MRTLLFTLVLCGTLHASAQDSIDPIETDRPDQTESPSVVAVKHIQIETGFSAESAEGELRIFHPDILWRVGIFKTTELRVITTISSSKDSTGKFKAGIAPVEIGFKTVICKEYKARPKIAFLAHLAIPYLSSKNQRTKYFAPNFLFAMQHTIKEYIILSYNIGTNWDGISPDPIFIYTITNGFVVKKKWYFYYEFFGQIPLKMRSTHTFDAGLAYMIRKNMQVDLSAGIQLFPFAKGWYSSIGYSFRLPH